MAPVRNVGPINPLSTNRYIQTRKNDEKKKLEYLTVYFDIVTKSKSIIMSNMLLFSINRNMTW